MAAIEQDSIAAPQAQLGPVRPLDRIFTLDLVRGLAVLGILAVNAITFAQPLPVIMNPSLQTGFEGEAVSAWQVMHVFFQDKMRTLFSMLFGASIFLIGGERSDKARGKLLRRRLFWLALFGLLHGLAFWFGDILLLYAWTGLFVMLARSWRARTLIITGVVLNVICSALYVGLMMSLSFAPPGTMDQVMADMGYNASPEQIAGMIAAMQGDALSVTGQVVMNWLQSVPFMLIFMMPATAALMMIGMGLYKTGFFSGRAPVAVYGALIVLGAGALYLIWRESEAIIASGFDFMTLMPRPAITFLAPLASLAYASALILLVKFGLRFILTPLASVGRMAFTNYLSQTLIMTTIFYGGRGLGLFGQVAWPELWLYVIGIWIVQLIWSPLWLSRFSMGPLEWLWRRLTYGRALKA
ncbi:MAG: DUF418 domain-containing protein [Brevundimonas sp.]|jgi:uncharacterized protein|uniref:DUF418 domain-containing protein n=1 Tax=Brevundimonas sp. TaxID=1871086 RepID=UPI00391D8BB3